MPGLWSGCDWLAVRNIHIQYVGALFFIAEAFFGYTVWNLIWILNESNIMICQSASQETGLILA
jgi:hypothetical protein